MVHLMNKYDPEDDIKHAFSVFDKDGNGFITAPELKEFMMGIGETTLTDAEVKEMIAAVDKDKDGSLSYDEFKAMMEAKK